MIIKYATGACEIESSIAMAKQLSTATRRRRIFPSKLDINLRKNLVKCCIGNVYFCVAES
jgi:hypothetical protein